MEEDEEKPFVFMGLSHLLYENEPDSLKALSQKVASEFIMWTRASRLCVLWVTAIWKQEKEQEIGSLFGTQTWVQILDSEDS